MLLDEIGPIAVGTRLRMLGERLMEDATKILDLYGVPTKPKWFPVFYILARDERARITDIAEEIGHSHPAVSKTVREMVKAGIATEAKDPSDGRVTWFTLTEAGREANQRIQLQYEDLNTVVRGMLDQGEHHLWEALREFEGMLDEQSMWERVRTQWKRREQRKVEIVDYTPQYRQAFYDLNMEWVQRYFTVEEADRAILEHPQEYILDRGGRILMALYQGEPVGACSLVKMDDPEYDYELAKMGVRPAAQGLGVGYLLGQATLDLARELGANTVYLESNSSLTPAIRLYQKLGFVRVPHRPTPYSRADVHMAITL